MKTRIWLRLFLFIGATGMSTIGKPDSAVAQDYASSQEGIVQSSPSDVIFANPPYGFPDSQSTVDQGPVTILVAEEKSASPEATQPLSEEEVRKVIEKYLKEKEEAAQAKLTPKEIKDKELAMTAKWNDGLELSTKDNAFRAHIGGRFQLDTAWYSVPQNVNNNIKAIGQNKRTIERTTWVSRGRCEGEPLRHNFSTNI